jgi:cysteinyl-tRNA synthetase
MRLFNTLSGAVEEFVPRDEGRVTMYVCGPTVYSDPHFGHARAALVPDVLRRYLRWIGCAVFFVRNITDIDDKIIARAQAEGRHPAEVAETYTRAYDEQMARMGMLAPDIAPRATGHVTEMIELIQRLVAVGAAYESDGDVFFSVRAFDAYGKLSGQSVDDLRAGARIDPDERKRDAVDFALWKAAKPGEPSWPSPWGRGRPGWHIECSAMAGKYLGPAFDIHTGGLDLAFPHHENEIAQSEAATGRRFARYWVHNGLLNLAGEKMSKSLGNVLALDEALDRYGADTLRLFFLSAHYRSPVEFSEDRLREAVSGLDRWRAFLRVTAGMPGAADARDDPARERFRAAMDDDLGTPQAQAVLFDLVTEGHAALAAGRVDEAAAARATLLELTDVLGYRLGEAAEHGALVGPLVEELLAQRAAARERKDFAAADALRARLAELGVKVEDSPHGARWHLV